MKKRFVVLENGKIEVVSIYSQKHTLTNSCSVIVLGLAGFLRQLFVKVLGLSIIGVLVLEFFDICTVWFVFMRIVNGLIFVI